MDIQTKGSYYASEKKKKKEIITICTTSNTFPSTFPEFYHAYLIFSMLFVYYDFYMYSDVCCGSYKAKVQALLQEA